MECVSGTAEQPTNHRFVHMHNPIPSYLPSSITMRPNVHLSIPLAPTRFSNLQTIASTPLSLSPARKQSHRHTDTQTHRHTDTQTHTHTPTHPHTHTPTHPHTHTPTHPHTHTPTHSHTHTPLPSAGMLRRCMEEYQPLQRVTHSHTHTLTHSHTHTLTHSHTHTLWEDARCVRGMRRG